jgi:putative hydrolase of the HAD superfamily
MPTKVSAPVTTLFLDIGGVLLTNGWDHLARQRAVKAFKLNRDEVERRHRLTFDTYEVGKLTLDEYLRRVVFYEKRRFTPARFRKFMFEQSKPFPRMIDLVRKLKAQYGVKIVVVSNEGRELNAYRIRTFKLNRFVDSFISSCFVHVRKPDEDIYHLALDVAQVSAEHVLYIDDRGMFTDVARGLGIRGIHHTDYESTRTRLSAAGLKVSE